MDLTSVALTVHEEGNLYYLTFPSFDRTGLVRHCFSTRRGGVSQGYFASMNLGFGRGDDETCVLENYRRICYVLGIYAGDLVFSDQVHGDRILYVDQQDRGKGIVQPVEMEEVDGLITDRPQVALVTLYADCVPLYFLDPVKKVIGLAHSGWRGTVQEIGRKMVERFAADFHSDPQDILAGIGPSIGPCCFEVGPEVVEAFAETFPEWIEDVARMPAGKVKAHIDLWETNRRILERAGLLPDHITVPDICTTHRPEYFHSHRRSGGNRGSQAAILELR